MAGEIFTEILPYLEVEQGNKEQIPVVEKVVVPDIVGKTINEAEKELKNAGLTISINGEYEGIDKGDIKITNQIPESGVTVNKETLVYTDIN